ncbi:UDP-N-acetylmuramoyl-tripeptide--D-alanyl-D-alanine ligase [Anseongella ginsenosidimutans]|uniref:UDP-N-acetylmuramoyl-tripeptide--D-alanyl-D-alanine ligase n=1 Tax=Anseongella ginsenosidimutans TaxID=496056 RepID=A0A4R3KMN5_9SPHI|nr:UDP-N-acetylmuramoyl-tripeptide--D-alanyl-D-alanine ligase [Anseongella ginsenosidimutans]QEC52066.1 UDP-N-acetylmuramoyl-tripeptide--D-alanyl-D-alanine ligase [Anseongella ginsenosidimutans]TCS85622.1 UDP-N-acetylmuramoyl-tripeptide--D-alanyl-D-alanine ligase [Anseongella ginsenosidimutans]
MKTEDLYSLFRLHPAVSTDSRAISPDSLFFALKGPHFNGNAYARQALEAGAAYAIVDEEAYAGNERCILVQDVLNSLQNLAWHHRNQFTIPVLGITGSNGKTTTKELLYSVLSQQFNTLATKGNLNNHIGVPLTLLRINAETGMAIIEMGANHQKEIELLCSIARPTHGLITNVGKAHLEGFGSLEGVMKGKKELYDSLSINNGHAFVCADNPRLVEMSNGLTDITWYGTSPSCDIRGELTGSQPHLRFSWQKKGNEEMHTVNSALSGDYNFENLLAAVCVGDHFGLSAEQLKRGIEGYIPANNRSQEVEQGSNLVILDAYNANPGSMAAAIRHLASHPSKNKVAVLGDMFELGAYAEEEHASIIRLLEELAIPQACLIGPEFFRQRKTAPALHFFENQEEASAWLGSQRLSDSLILLKGSRGMQLEKLLPFLHS